MNKYPNWQDIKRVQRRSKKIRSIQYLKRFIKYIIPFFISLVVFLVLQFILSSNYFIDDTNANYILSSIAQGLASLVALLFVIIFFICQAVNDPLVFSSLLNPDGFFLLSIYIVTILFSIINIQIDNFDFLLNICISMSAFSLLSLFPFILVVKNLTKKFWVRNAIANLGIPKFPQENFKYGEFLSKLSRIGARDIVKMQPEIIIQSIIELLETIFRSETDAPNKASSISLLADIGSFALIVKDYKGTFNLAKQKVASALEENAHPTNVKKKTDFGLSCSAIYTMLVSIKLHNKLDAETRLYFAKTLTRSLAVIFYQIRRQGNDSNKLKETQKTLEGVALSYTRRELVSTENFRAALDDTLSLFETSKEMKDDFKGYLENLLSS